MFSHGKKKINVMPNPKCKTCDRDLHIKDRDRNGNPRYRCPGGCSQRTKRAKTCPVCGDKIYMRRANGKQYWTRCQCKKVRDWPKCFVEGCDRVLVKNGHSRGTQMWKCPADCDRGL